MVYKREREREREKRERERERESGGSRGVKKCREQLAIFMVTIHSYS